MVSCALATSLVLALAVTLTAAVGDEDAKVEIVSHGSTIKLEHVASAHRLHSHDVSYGSGSGQQSVTGVSFTGDPNSFWIVKCGHGERLKLAGMPVRCGDSIRLQHLSTSKNLHSHDHRAPMNRDFEVSAYAAGHEGKWANGDLGDDWVVECVKGKGDWKRFDQVRFKHQEKGLYLSASTSLKFGDPIPNQLQISASNKKNANTIWRTNEGFYIGPTIN